VSSLPPERPLLIYAADELRRLADVVDSLGAALCDDPLVVAEHGVLLQAIDLVVQQHRSLARLIDAEALAGTAAPHHAGIN